MSTYYGMYAFSREGLNLIVFCLALNAYLCSFIIILFYYNIQYNFFFFVR